MVTTNPKGEATMTIDLSTLEAGDTVELRCGGRVVVDYTAEFQNQWSVHSGGFSLYWYKKGNLSLLGETPFDIIAIHKKPKPLISERFCSFTNMDVRVIYNHDTGEITAEVVK